MQETAPRLPFRLRERLRALPTVNLRAIWPERSRSRLRRWLRARLSDKWRDRIEWLVAAGTEGYPRPVQRRLRILNVMCYLIAVATLGYAFQYILMGYQTFKPVIWINFGLVVVALAVPLAHRFSEIAGGLMIAIAELAALTAFTAYLGRPSGIQLQLIVGAAVPFFILGLGRPWLTFSIVVFSFVLHLVAWFGFSRHDAIIPADSATLAGIYVGATVTTFVLISATVYYAFQLAERAQEEADSLLRNILPDSVAERLKDNPDAGIADGYDDATVLFVDLAGFTPLSQELGPPETVRLLNTIVTEFDQIARRHGVEKIKTIGDAYMAVAGVPEVVDDHAERIALTALDMRKAIARFTRELDVDVNVRIGLASGPLMAGIIGMSKFSYDIWGSTVNLAARMESHGVIGKIQVPSNVKQRLDDEFLFERRGMVEVKGVGWRETWFLEATAGDDPPDQPT